MKSFSVNVKLLLFQAFFWFFSDISYVIGSIILENIKSL
jgi:hypothetical protein